METIHLKTIDPVSQQLLRLASRRGIELSWERYERLQPQDGFLRLGLSCPYGCMQGPCRIDPFARGPRKGACGLGRDEMVAGMLLRLCLQGAMDAAGLMPSSDGFPAIRFSPELNEMLAPVLAKNSQHALSAGDMVNAGAMLQRPSGTIESLLLQSLRISLLTLGLLEQNAPPPLDSIKYTAGYGTLTDRPVRIGFSGRPSTALAQALERECQLDAAAPVALAALGEWILLKDRFMPIACTSGESELLVSAGAIHLLVAGPGTTPGLLDLCKQLNVPVAAAADISDAAAVVQRARQFHATRSQTDLFADVSPAGEGRVVMSRQEMSRLSLNGSGGRLAILGGTDTLQLPLGQLPVELATALRDSGLQIAGWGDAALWMLKNGPASGEPSVPPLTLENREGPLLALKGLAAAGQLDRLAGICFTGLGSCRELAAVLGLAYLGCRVCVATPIPLQGSQAVCAALAGMLQQSGGQLAHFDHPARASEILEWFMARQG